MSFREEERQKSNCPSRGLGLAAAAIGIGVGAAMYYFFSKRPENPHGEGSTASEWQTETLDGHSYEAAMQSDMDVDSDGYSTISENVTSDTSVHDDGDFNASITQSLSSDSEMHSDYSYDHDSDTETSFSDSDTSELSVTGDENDRIASNVNNSFESGSPRMRTIMNSSMASSDSDVAFEWDITNSSEGVPDYSVSRSSIRRFFGNVSVLISPRSRWNLNRMTEEEQLNILRDQAFRERPWTTEECSICFELIRREQDVMTLPCTHHFHQACILPWLQEQQTCPNCRKRID